MVMEVDEDCQKSFVAIDEVGKNHDKVECEVADHRMDTMPGCSYDSIKDINSRISHSHSKKVIKHALRQQAKRRRKNTTIASGNSAPLPRIVVKSLPPQPEDTEVKDSSNNVSPKPATMREVLASIPGFSIKPRKRSTKRLSAAAQLEQTKEGCIDLETPDSILVNTNLRALLNKHTFSSLPSLYQYKLVQLLPDKHEPAADTSQLLLPSPARPSLKTTIKLRPSTSASGRHNKIVPSLIPRRLRTVGAVTRAITSYHRVREEADSTAAEEITSEDICDETGADITEPEPEPESEAEPDVEPEPEAEPEYEAHQQIEDEEEEEEDDESDSEMKVEESVCDGVTTELGAECDEEQSIGPATVYKGTHFDNSASEQETDKSPNEINVKYGTENTSVTTESNVCEMHVDEYKSEEDIALEMTGNKASDNFFNVFVKEEDNNGICSRQTNNENDKSENSTQSKCEEFKESSESDSRNNGNMENQKESLCSSPNFELEDSEMYETAQESKMDVDDPKISDLTEHDTNIVQEVTASDADPSSYELDSVPDQYVIHESAILSSTDYVNKAENVNQHTGNSKENKSSDNKMVVEASTEVGSMSDHEDLKAEEEEDSDDVRAALIAAAVAGSDGCCWDMVDSTEKFLAEVPVDVLQAVPVPVVPVTLAVVDENEPVDEVEVIPMKEELEVRLEEGTFPVAPEELSMEWPYAVKMDSAIVAAALEETGDGSSVKSTQAQYPEYSTSQAVKLELEVTLTPEAVTSADSLVTSTVGGTQNNTTATSTPPTVSKTNVATVIPPTTIVCLPSAVSTPNLINSQLTSCLNAPSSSNVVSSSLTKTAAVASSSAVPYLALSSNTPVRAIPTQLPKSQNKSKPRDSSQPPPGAVNLERSYQICQAVIQNSPNRDQLRCQLKPPPSLLAANSSSSSGANKKSEGSGSSRAATQYGVVTSSRNGGVPNNPASGKPFTPPLPAPGSYPVVPGNNGVNMAKPVASMGAQGKVTSSRGGTYHQRQQSPPVVVRHVFTSSQGIPVTMAVLPQSQAPPEVAESSGAQLGHVGQYILVQRTGVGDQPETVQVMLNSCRKGAPPPPRASSAPPSNNQAITRKDRMDTASGGGVQYGDVGSDSALQSYTIGDIAIMEQSVTNSYPQQPVVVQGGGRVVPRQTHNNHIAMPRTDPSQCACNLKAMIMCQKCGAFCHDDCIGPSRLCVTCLIRL
ncbi:hypothetical protein C0J52_08862 [Blattella germanica]|nr:hypothetical protein C0J52_08862 [Blattella germanica]